MLVVLPILVPLVAAAVCLLLRPRAEALLVGAVVTALPMLATALLLQVGDEGIQVQALGGWQAPFGIVLVADRFAALMVLLGTIVGAATTLFVLAERGAESVRPGQRPLTLMLLGAVSGAFLAGDLFNLYVWFELMLVASFGLMILDRRRDQLAGAITYVVMNLLSSTLFLVGAGLVYGTTGTLNLADLSLRLAQLDRPEMATLLGAPLLTAFAVKAAIVPFIAWLPASYPALPSGTAALFAGLLTKVGVYALIRASTLAFGIESDALGGLLVAVAGATMLVGVLGAVAQTEIRRILSFHIVSQIGYMLMGLGLALVALRPGGDPALATLALGGSVLYILHHIVVKTNLFLIAGLIEQARGTTDLARLGGLARTNPLVALLFLLTALSLAGIPILSGFWAKLVLLRAGLSLEAWTIVAIALVTSLLTLTSMMKIWVEAFWREVPADARAISAPVGTTAPVAAMTLLALAIGFGAAPAWALSSRAAAQLLDAGEMQRRVLPPAGTSAVPVAVAPRPAEPRWGAPQP